MNFNISKMVYLLQLANNHGTFTFVNILLCTSFKDFHDIFLQQWSNYVCQTAFGAVVCKY